MLLPQILQNKRPWDFRFVASPENVLIADIVTVFALVLVFEGVVYALFPSQMKTFMERMMGMPTSTLRNSGLVAAVAGVLLVWLIRG